MMWILIIVVMPMWIMCSNQDVWFNIGFLTFFVFLFVVSVAYWTNASRPEIFMATAAYTALLVVFLGAYPNGSFAFDIVAVIHGNTINGTVVSTF